MVDVVVQNPQKSNEYEYEKTKHVRRDSKMCCFNMVVDVVVQNPQKSNEYEYGKKHVRRDSNMCCCYRCRRFCFGAPTTDERIHAPVRHDASQIAYCRS